MSDFARTDELDRALKHEGEYESHGANRSPFIDGLNKWIGCELGSSYCATFVSWILMDRLKSFGSSFRSASSQVWKRWAQAQGICFTDPQRLKKCTAALYGRTSRTDKRFGHIGFVRCRYTGPDGEVLSIEAFSANSSETGKSNNGSGFWSTRLDTDGLWFIDLTSFGFRWYPKLK